MGGGNGLGEWTGGNVLGEWAWGGGVPVLSSLFSPLLLNDKKYLALQGELAGSEDSNMSSFVKFYKHEKNFLLFPKYLEIFSTYKMMHFSYLATKKRTELMNRICVAAM